MKEALKKIKAENLASGQTGDQDGESIVQQFRSYEDLKSDFAKINAGIKTDLEVIKELLAEWRRSTADRANRIRILSEFEYHLRQIDNAQNFVQLGGLELLMSQINGTFSNGSESVAAIKAGFLPVLLRAMLAGSGLEQQTRSASVLALASLCRNFPLAQTVLLKSGGLAALRSAFDSRDTDRARVLADRHPAVGHGAGGRRGGGSRGIRRRRQLRAASASGIVSINRVSVAKAIAETGWCSSSHHNTLLFNTSRCTTLLRKL
uniref:Nucleotide exchange factor SIL1 n=1 Tax=Macrostomum lignano TaxID=282301 RepID=A0A1I8FNK6_9PLAT